MADCPSLQGCPFFNDKMDANTGLGAMFKQKYCLGDNSECARFMVAKELGKEAVPSNLYPNMLERAKKIIAGNT